MTKKPSNHNTQELNAHARRHRLKLLAFENITRDTLTEAKELVCESARRLASKYQRGDRTVDFASPAAVTVIVSTRRDMSPVLCHACRQERPDNSSVV